MKVRRYITGEEVEIWGVYYGATRYVVVQDYTEEQVKRWAPDDRDMDEWSERLVQKNPFVAVIDGRIVGFAELESDGHIDYFYCHKDYQRRGVGSALMQTIEEEARELALESLHAEVSVTAMPFFRSKGFEVRRERCPIICGAPAKQYIMDKTLIDAP